MIGGRTRGTSKSKHLHFASRPKRHRTAKFLMAVGVVVVLLLAAGAVKAAVAPEPALRLDRVIPARLVLPGSPPHPAWPANGEAGVEVEGLPPLGTSGPATPVPVASLAKIMTAYVILRDSPLRPGVSGYTVTVTAAQAADYRQRLASSQSVVAVAAGEQLTELQLLQGLLVASGNNLASILADHDAGSQAAFVAKMQSTALSLGMTHTTYTDPSGLEGSTVSTAADQLILAARAMADPVFASIVAQTSVTLPVAGRLANFNQAVGTNGYIGVKTGSDSTAGGCLVFADRRQVGGHAYTILGVVLGQDQGYQSTQALLAAARGAADALVRSVAAGVGMETVVPSGTVVATVTNAQGRRARVSTTSPVVVMGYGGMTIPLSVDLGAVGTTVHAGQPIGKVSVAGSPSVTATARSAVPDVSYGWKLRHDF